MADLQEPQPDLEQLLSVIIVQNQRIYDVLLVILANSNQEAYNNIIARHESMGHVGPVPFKTDDDDD